MTPNINDYVGIPYGFRDEPGMDCYQLVITVLREVFGKNVPDYLFGGTWKTADAGFNEHKVDFEKVAEWDRQPGDVVLLRIGRKPLHCGVVINHSRMLHSMRGHNSCVESFNSISWRNRIEGFYRWHG